MSKYVFCQSCVYYMLAVFVQFRGLRMQSQVAQMVLNDYSSDIQQRAIYNMITVSTTLFLYKAVYYKYIAVYKNSVYRCYS